MVTGGVTRLWRASHQRVPGCHLKEPVLADKLAPEVADVEPQQPIERPAAGVPLAAPLVGAHMGHLDPDAFSAQHGNRRGSLQRRKKVSSGGCVG
jgi:hypothetical protein